MKLNNIFLIKENKKCKNIKRQILWFAFLLLCSASLTCTTVNATVVRPTQSFYVNDYANILSSSTEQYIINTNVELQKKTGAQIVVVTVPSLDGMSIEEYAHELFNNFGIGDKNKNNGLLLLCSYGDRMFRVEVGDVLEGILPDGKTGRIQDEYIIPYLKENNFDEGIKNGYSAFLQEVSSEYNVEITESQTAVRQESADSEDFISFIVAFCIFMAIYIAIFITIFKHGGRGGPFIFYGRRKKWIPWRRIFWWTLFFWRVPWRRRSL